MMSLPRIRASFMRPGLRGLVSGLMLLVAPRVACSSGADDSNPASGLCGIARYSVEFAREL